MRDDGQGFDTTVINTAASASMGGNGLKNMQMRANEIEGNFQMVSHPGKGTQVSLEFPIP